ncbi:MAG: SDR family oxidoreductase [Pseudomonadota bacterium]
MSTQERLSLAGELVVLTGGLGRLGQQFCSALVECGADVAVIEHPAVAAKQPEHPNPGAHTFPCDVCDRADLESTLAAIQKHWGRTPTGLVNCAAIDSPPDAPAEENGPFETYPVESWENVMNVNVTGVFLCCQVFGGAMAKENKGAIVNISSIYGILSPDQSLYEYRRAQGQDFFKPVAYSASKSAIINLSRYLATYWGSTKVRVNTLTLAGVFDNQDDEFLDAYCKKVPLGRMADPDEYNGAVAFLLSDAARYMTGSNLVIDGGFSAW